MARINNLFISNFKRHEKIIIRTLFFVVPVFVLYFINLYFFDNTGNLGGDLARVGYLWTVPGYRDIFKKEFSQKKHYVELADYLKVKKTKQKFNFLIIGDSFTEQGTYGYGNYLAQKDSISVIHFSKELKDRVENPNPIQMLMAIANGDILDSLEVDNIVLQSVERSIIMRTKNFDYERKLIFDSLLLRVGITKQKETKVVSAVQSNKKEDKTKKSRDDIKKEEHEQAKYKLFSDKLLKVPLANLLYLFTDKPFVSAAYRVKVTDSFFTGKKNEVLFNIEDFGNCVKYNNNYQSVLLLDSILNTLSKKLQAKGVKLIVLPSPDKYDLFYEYIKNKKKYPKPLFFDYFNPMPKDYLYVNAKKILGDAMKVKKDVYFYDDTHWSPWGSQIIANELIKITSKK